MIMECDIDLENSADTSVHMPELHGNENVQSQVPSPELSQSFLSASELNSFRENLCKNKNKDEDVQLYKGPKLYYPCESVASEEIMEDILQDNKKTLELQRIVKNRDCLKAEWNEELKVAIVPYLKGKTTQHMGVNMKGKCALLPEEALFLLEKGVIEVLNNNFPLSVEEAYSVMLKGKASVEKYQVYCFLSQQGFIVVRHQSRIGPSYGAIMNLSRKKQRKRKAEMPAIESSKPKRLTFTGVLSSNSEKSSINVENSALSRECLLNNDEEASGNVKSVSCNTLSSEQNIADMQDINEKVNPNVSNDDTVSSNFINHIESDVCTEKVKSLQCLKEQNIDDNIRMLNDVVGSKDCENMASYNKEVDDKPDKPAIDIEEEAVKNIEVDVENANDDEIDIENVNNDEIDVENANNEVDVENANNEEIDVEIANNEEIDVEIANNVEIDVENVDNEKIDVEIANNEKIDVEIANDEEIDVENAKNDEIDVENANNDEIDVENDDDDDTNLVILEDEKKGSKSNDINVEGSCSGYYDDEESVSSDVLPILYEESDDGSLDVYSCSPDGNHGVPDLNVEVDNLDNRRTHDQEDEVTLVKVMKKEKKPLAVIDLLSEEEDNSSFEDQDRAESSERQPDKTNGEEVYEDSDDDIQVLEIIPVNNTQATSRSVNPVKLESGKIKAESSNVKTQYKLKESFPNAFKTDLLCVSRPSPQFLPAHVQPAKEAYVLKIKSSSSQQQRQGRVWNSFRDMQDYQRERRLDRSMNSFNARPSGSFRGQNDPFSNHTPPPFNTPGYSRDIGFDRNQNYAMPPNRNFYEPMNNDRGLLPTPNTFNSPNHMPFSMNMPNLQHLSSSNPAEFVNEIQKTVYTVASTMINNYLSLNQHLNPNNPPPAVNPAFNELSMTSFSSHAHNNNFSSNMDPMAFNSSGRSDFHPMRFPPDPLNSGERFSFPRSGPPFMAENNWRPQNNFRQRNFPPRGPSFPCRYRSVHRKRDWNDVKAAVEGTNQSDSGSDIEEVPINLNQFLYSNDIKPLVKPGTKLPVADVLKALKITQMANLCDTRQYQDRYLPATSTLEISFDVYLPNSKYKRSEPSVPKYRIIVVRSSDQIPKYSELVCLQRKWNDGASLQVAVVDHGDVSFYSFNSITIQEIEPFDS